MPSATTEKTIAETAREQAVDHDRQVNEDQARMEAARAAAADASIPAEMTGPLSWQDVKPGDDIEVFTFGPTGWVWGQRTVIDVDWPAVRLRVGDDLESEYELDGGDDVTPVRWPEPTIEEDPDGQQRIGGPGTEPTFSTDAGGSPPHEAELALKAKKIEWPTDLRRGSSVLLLVWAYVDEVRVGSGTKQFVAEIGRHMLVEHPTMRPHEVMDALQALESRPRRDRAMIDQAAKIAAELVDGAGGIVDLDLAVAMRERLYERYGIDDDAVEATHGTPDHEEPGEDGENDSRSIGEITQGEADSIDAAEEAAAVGEPGDD